MAETDKIMALMTHLDRFTGGVSFGSTFILVAELGSTYSMPWCQPSLNGRALNDLSVSLNRGD